MTTIGWILVIIGALVNFLAKPVLNKISNNNDPEQKLLYIVKILGLCVVIVGAVIIFMVGGKING
ncbi:MAG: hypothetical protein E7400_04530 [Ruminococcaceae bacterium]|nr:hypothetical protein [Oscillospiraceae bacterium]